MSGCIPGEGVEGEPGVGEAEEEGVEGGGDLQAVPGHGHGGLLPTSPPHSTPPPPSPGRRSEAGTWRKLVEIQK